MGSRVLIVEDEIFVAIDIEHVVSEMGLTPIGIAADREGALRLARRAEIAIVDLNLRDGPTGYDIGRKLAAEHGVTVMFMTANPGQLGGSVPGTLGVLPKPVAEEELRAAIDFAVAHRNALPAAPPPRMMVFENRA